MEENAESFQFLMWGLLSQQNVFTEHALICTHWLVGPGGTGFAFIHLSHKNANLDLQKSGWNLESHLILYLQGTLADNPPVFLKYAYVEL